jgi:histo-blood group ABO system transferase
MNTALLVIATGEHYWKYTAPLLASAKQYFPDHEACLFTDSPKEFGVYKVRTPDLGFPTATLKRYHLFLTQEASLAKFDYVFYVDVDAVFAGKIGSEIFGPNLTAVVHMGFNQHTDDWFLESRPESSAYLPASKSYYCGGFNGGTSKAFLNMSRAIRAAVDQDAENGLIARWHDESHLNRYLSDNPPSTVLGIDYGFPQKDLEGYKGIPKLLWL